MISQLKSNSVVEIKGTRTRVTDLDLCTQVFRDISIVLYGKKKELKIAKWIGTIKGIGQVAVVVVKEKRKKTRYLVSTNIYLPALEILKYYARRWKIEQMIKDLKATVRVRTLSSPESSCYPSPYGYHPLELFCFGHAQDPANSPENQPSR